MALLIVLLAMAGLSGSVQGLVLGQFRAGGSPAGVPQDAVPVEPPHSPTQNAIYVSTRDELVNALCGPRGGDIDTDGRRCGDAPRYLGYTTIYVADDAYIDLSAMDEPLPLHAGVTLMSGRAGIRGGAVLYTNRFDTRFLFEVMGNNVKVRGLRFRGPSGSHERALTGMAAIRVRVNQARHVEITDNEFWNWTYAGVAVRGNYSSPDEFRRMTRDEARQVYIARNYMHHNVRDGLGYGVVVSDGAYAVMEGNVFDYNRHAIASDGSPYTGYVARFNYVLSGGHCQEGKYVSCFYNQHFDVHGTGEDGYGGVAGEVLRHGFQHLPWRAALLLAPDPSRVHVAWSPRHRRVFLLQCRRARR